MGALLVLATLAGSSSAAGRPGARVVPVADVAGLRAAIEAAQSGDVIVLADGQYDVGGNLVARAAGNAAAPIVVRAERAGGARLRFDGRTAVVEAFHVQGPYWTFEGLDIEGTCADDSTCEHAFHIVGLADHTTVRGNRVHGFNAHIKGNGLPDAAGRPFPDDVLVEGNEFFNERARRTSNPVTPIDVVGGQRWVVRANHIHDAEKGQGDHISYAAFLKGNSRNGLFERNLVECAKLTSGGTRVGLSLGGGGSAPDRICEGGTCEYEHQDGTLRNNIILNCTDVGIYLNKATRTKVYNNTIYNTTGIDVRFIAADADIRSNLLTGRIRERDGGRANLKSNLTVSAMDFGRWFRSPGQADFTLLDGSAIRDKADSLLFATDDYCGQARPGGAANDLGAVEYLTDAPCDTTHPVVGPTATPTPPATAPPTPTATEAPSTDPPPTATATMTAAPTRWFVRLPWAGRTR